MKQFKKAFLERALGAEMTHHLGYEPGGRDNAAQHNNANIRQLLCHTDGGPVCLQMDIVSGISYGLLVPHLPQTQSTPTRQVGVIRHSTRQVNPPEPPPATRLSQRLATRRQGLHTAYAYWQRLDLQVNLSQRCFKVPLPCSSMWCAGRRGPPRMPMTGPLRAAVFFTSRSAGNRNA
jgi:hypothetical protein